MVSLTVSTGACCTAGAVGGATGSSIVFDSARVDGGGGTGAFSVTLGDGEGNGAGTMVASAAVEETEGGDPRASKRRKMELRT